MTMSCVALSARFLERHAVISVGGTYHIEVATLVRCAFGSFEGPLEMKRRVVDKLYVYMRCLVILAICTQLFSTSPRTCNPNKA